MDELSRLQATFTLILIGSLSGLDQINLAQLFDGHIG